MDQSILPLVSLISFLFVIISVFFLRKEKKYKNLPPSPPSYPIIGHMHLIKEPVHRTLENLSYKYGPIFSLRFGSSQVVVISTPSAVEESFVKHDVIFANRPLLLVGKHFNYDFTTMVTAPYGQIWRNVRRVATLEFFSTTKLNIFLSIRQDETKALLKNLFKDSCTKVEMNSRLSDLSFNIVTRMVAGKRYFGDDVEDVEEAKNFRNIIGEIFELSGAATPEDFISFLRWFDFRGIQKTMVRLGKESDAFFQSLVDEHRNRKGVSQKTLVDNMLALQHSDPETYRDDIIKGTINSLLSAGTDTSTVTIEWALSLLLNHPEVLKRAQEEINTVVGQSRLVDEPDIPKLKYLQCIINETLRLFPPAPLLVPHFSTEDCTIGGFDIPRGTMLIANAWAIHRDENLWDNAASFRPERFDCIDNVTYKFIPFGLGRRQCPGAGLANRVVGLVLASLLQNFEWERPSKELVDLSEGKGLTMPKAKPLEAICRARKGMIDVLSNL